MSKFIEITIQTFSRDDKFLFERVTLFNLANIVSIASFNEEEPEKGCFLECTNRASDLGGLIRIKETKEEIQKYLSVDNLK